MGLTIGASLRIDLDLDGLRRTKLASLVLSGKKPSRVMFALFIIGFMASMASAEPDPQFFYYPSYYYSAPSYYYPSYVYPKKVEAPPKKVAEPEEMAPEVVEPQVTVKKVEKPLLRPIVPFFGLRSGEVQFLRPDEARPQVEQ